MKCWKYQAPLESDTFASTSSTTALRFRSFSSWPEEIPRRPMRIFKASHSAVYIGQATVEMFCAGSSRAVVCHFPRAAKTRPSRVFWSFNLWVALLEGLRLAISFLGFAEIVDGLGRPSGVFFGGYQKSLWGRCAVSLVESRRPLRSAGGHARRGAPHPRRRDCGPRGAARRAERVGEAEAVGAVGPRAIDRQGARPPRARARAAEPQNRVCGVVRDCQAHGFSATHRAPVSDVRVLAGGRRDGGLRRWTQRLQLAPWRCARQLASPTALFGGRTAAAVASILFGAARPPLPAMSTPQRRARWPPLARCRRRRLTRRRAIWRW